MATLVIVTGTDMEWSILVILDKINADAPCLQSHRQYYYHLEMEWQHRQSSYLYR